jgi:hypothetical protein
MADNKCNKKSIRGNDAINRARTARNKARRIAKEVRRYDTKRYKIRRWAAKHGVHVLSYLTTCREIRAIVKEHRRNAL